MNARGNGGDCTAQTISRTTLGVLALANMLDATIKLALGEFNGDVVALAELLAVDNSLALAVGCDGVTTL